MRDETPKHQFLVDISPNGADGKLLPEISAGPAGEPGAADRKVQAYNFRMILSHDPANQVAYPEARELRRRAFRAVRAATSTRCTKKQGHPPRLGEVHLRSRRSPIRRPTSTTTAPFSTDYIGKTWDYPNATYARRAEIWQDHEEYTKGFFWFLAHDPRVPAALQKEANEWGLAKDEFMDNGHWPYQLYIREARRMVGEYVMSQKDIQTELTKPDPIGMGSYNSDSHNVQRIVNRGRLRAQRRRHAGGGEAVPDPVPRAAAEEGRDAEPAGAGLLFGDPRGLQHAAHGAAVHDSRAGGGSRGRDGDPPRTWRCRTSIPRN